MNATFFPARADTFRPTRSWHPAPEGQKPFGVLSLVCWDGRPGNWHAKIRNGVDVYFDSVDDLDAVIRAAQLLRQDMAAARPDAVIHEAAPDYHHATDAAPVG
jgi:hypothetical protein